MIDSWVESEFIQEDKVFVFDFLIKGFHFRSDVRGSDHMFGLFKADFSNVDMKKGRNVADNNFSFINKRTERERIGDIDFGVGASERIEFFC
jgi:hypothetical protein